MDGAVIPEEEKDGLVSAEKMPTCVTADTYEKGHSLVEAVDINKDEPFEANVNDATHGNLSKEERTLVEENEKLREMLETLLNAGKAQLGVIADLNGRVRDLERKLTQKRRCKVKSSKPRTSPRKCSGGPINILGRAFSSSTKSPMTHKQVGEEMPPPLSVPIAQSTE
ncbi:hypothetical protein BHE74_00020921 [Ensete ventricosum]|nr:hypothetical protein BHE74_00020921 [Ensete ventricosum]